MFNCAFGVYLTRFNAKHKTNIGSLVTLSHLTHKSERRCILLLSQSVTLAKESAEGIKMAEHWSAVLKTMNERRKQGELCDFRILVEGKTFPVHRPVLDSCSEYFRLMFASNMRESNEGVCELKDTKADVARICIDFMYTGEMDITVDVAAEVLSLSHMWQLNKVVQKCQEVLRKNLDVKRCFDSWRIAKLYKLGPLLDDSIRFIFSNLQLLRENVNELTSSELVEILKMQKLDLARGYNLGYLWLFCTQWTIEGDCFKEFCQIANLIPFGDFSYPVFRNTIWKHPHVRDCDNCRKSVGLSFLHSGKSASVENCLFLTHLANCYDQAQGERFSKFIAQNSEAVFAHPDFAQFVTEQNLLDCLSRLSEKKCSKREWSSIITWLKFDSNREAVFPKIFKDGAKMDETNTFLESQRNFDGSIGTFQQALYIKTLAVKYSCKTAENSADNLIAEQFSRVVLSPEYSYFSSKDLIKYMENPKIYSAEETLIWEAILNWVNADCEARTKEFPAIFRSLQLQKFSIPFLGQTVCNSRVVTEHPDCLSRLVDFLFAIVHQSEINHRSDQEALEAKIKSLDVELEGSRAMRREMTEMNNKLKNLTLGHENMKTEMKNQIDELKEFVRIQQEASTDKGSTFSNMQYPQLQRSMTPHADIYGGSTMPVRPTANVYQLPSPQFEFRAATPRQGKYSMGESRSMAPAYQQSVQKQFGSYYGQIE